MNYLVITKNNEVEVITNDHKRVTTTALTNLKTNVMCSKTSKKITKTNERNCKS